MLYIGVCTGFWLQSPSDVTVLTVAHWPEALMALYGSSHFAGACASLSHFPYPYPTRFAPQQLSMMSVPIERHLPNLPTLFR